MRLCSLIHFYHVCPHLRWIDGDGDEQLSKQVDLNNFGDDREFGWSDIYKGQTMARLLGDILDFYPQDTEDLGLQLQLKLDLGGSVAAAWNTDLIKLYFAADEGRETVMRCVAGDQWKGSIKVSVRKVKDGCMLTIVGKPSTAAFTSQGILPNLFK